MGREMGMYLLDGRDATLREEDEAFHVLLAAQAVNGRTAFHLPSKEREQQREKGQCRKG